MNPPGTSRLILLAILFLICPMLNVSEGNDQKKSPDSSRSSLIEISRCKVTDFTVRTAVVGIFDMELAGGFTVSTGESVAVSNNMVTRSLLSHSAIMLSGALE